MKRRKMFEADAEAAVLVKPGVGSLEDPTESTETASMSVTSLRDQRSDAATFQMLSVVGGILGAIGEDHGRTPPSRSIAPSKGRNAVDQGYKLCHVVFVAPGKRDHILEYDVTCLSG